MKLLFKNALIPPRPQSANMSP